MKLPAYEKLLTQLLHSVYDLRGEVKKAGRHPDSQRTAAKLYHQTALLKDTLGHNTRLLAKLNMEAYLRSTNAPKSYHDALDCSIRCLQRHVSRPAREFFSGKIDKGTIKRIDTGTISSLRLCRSLLQLTPRQRKKLLAKLADLGYIQFRPCGVKGA